MYEPGNFLLWYWGMTDNGYNTKMQMLSICIRAWKEQSPAVGLAALCHQLVLRLTSPGGLVWSKARDLEYVVRCPEDLINMYLFIPSNYTAILVVMAFHVRISAADMYVSLKALWPAMLLLRRNAIILSQRWRGGCVQLCSSTWYPAMQFTSSVKKSYSLKGLHAMKESLFLILLK